MNRIIFSLLVFFNLSFSPHIWAASGKYQSPLTVEGTETINLQQAKQMHAEGVIFIDVRSPRQYKKRHIPKAVHLYIKDGFTEENLLKLGDRDTPMIVYCNGAHCSLSYKAAEKAVAWGFTNIKYYRDGFRAWRKDGNPLEYGMTNSPAQ